METGHLEDRLPHSIEGIYYNSAACTSKVCIDYARTLHKFFLEFVGRPAGMDEDTFPLLRLDPADWASPFSQGRPEVE